MSDDTDEEIDVENQQIVRISAERLHISTIREGLNIEEDYPKISDEKDEDIDVENQQIKQISAENFHITEDGIAMEDDLSVSEDFQDSDDSEDSHDPKIHNAVYNNKVILGSKPTIENQSNSPPRSFGRLHIEESYRDGESVLIFGRKSVNLPVQTQTEEIKTQTPALRNTAVETTGSNSDLIGNEGKLCNHCDKSFTNFTLLVQHLYEMLPPDLSKCNESPAVADNPGGVKAYVDTVKAHSSPLKTVNLDPDTSEKKFYQCSKCGIFVHPMYIMKFKQHMLENHGINKPSTVLVPYNSNCKFCDSVISMHRNFNWHIRNMHENKFLDNPNKSVILHHKYHCQICNEVFLTHKLAMDHRHNKHPEMKGVHILREIKDVSRPTTTLVSKNVLFKCDQCQLHFTNYAVAIHHSSSLSNCHFSQNKNEHQSDWECQKCRLSFKVTDKKEHLHQHKYTDAFKVFTKAHTLRNRMLCKCPRCNLYLHDQDFWPHYDNKCEEQNGTGCLQCKVTIERASVKLHNELHALKGYSRIDMIWMEYLEVPNETSTPTATTVDKKVSSNTGVIETYKKTKPAEYKLKINYCQKCKCCMIDQSRSLKAHRTGQCVREYIERNRTICKSCGLLFNSHGTCPTRDMGLKISEIKFVSLEDQRIINPPIPKYNKCKKCGVNMRRPKRMDPHDCYGVKKTCIYCKEQFSDIIYQPHVALHVSRKAEMNVGNGTPVLLKLLTKDKKDYKGEPSETHKSNFLLKENDTSEDESSDDYNRDKEGEPPEIQNIIKKQEGELMLKRSHETDNEVPKKKENLVMKMKFSNSERNTLCELWKCADGLHFTSKDAAETHASRHHTGNKESSENCSQCGLLFDTSQLFKHLCKHHRNNQNVSFDVITVSPLSYNDSENGKPKDTESLKIKKRKSNAKRLMKIKNRKIKAQTSEKGKLYNCRGCNVNFMASSGLYTHVKENSAPDPVTCEECGLIFSKKGILAHKRHHHDKLQLTREDMNICRTSKCYGYKFVTDAVSAKNWQTKKAQTSEKGKLYYCRGCNVNFMASSGLYTHVKENSAPDPVTCEECGLIFSKKGIFAHKRYHHDKLQLTREDMNICGTSKCHGYQFVTVAVSAMDWQTKNVYRCDECSIYFSSYRGLRCHLDKLVHDESTTKCSLCKHVFSFPDFKRHVRINHRGTGVSIKELDVIGSKTLYKCARCEAHYVKEQSLDIHLIKSEHFCSMVHCPHCGLVFTETALLFHKSIHHPTKQTIKDFRIIVKSVANKGNASVEKKKQSAQQVKKYRNMRTLYKCFECKAHFLNLDTLRLHHHTVKVLKQRRKCPYCGLLFTPRTLARHTLVHHIKLKCKLEDFHILKPTGIRKHTSRKVVEHTEDDNLETLNELDKEIDVSNSESTSDIATINIEKRFLKKITLTNIRCVDGKYDSNRILYKCTDCQLHFITKNALAWHISYTDHSASENMVHCQDCGLGFTKKSLNRHKELQHEKNKLSLKDFKIATYLVNSDSNIEVLNGDKNDTTPSKDSDDELNKDSELREQDTPFPISNNYNNNLYKCDTCCIHFIDPDSLQKHKQNKKHETLKYNCTICDLDFDLVNLSTHIDIHHQKLSLNAEDFNIVSDNNESMDVDIVQGTEGSIVSLHRRPEAIADSISNRTSQRQEERRHKLYKCVDCDVYFMAQATCYRHVLNHKRMDPKKYIKCKICGLQFKIASLNKHVNRHHKTEGFKIENVLIEEFDPVNSSKRTILNKVQSRLVSTTTGKDEEVYSRF